MKRSLIRLPDNSYDHFSALYDEAGFDRFSLCMEERVRKLIRLSRAKRVGDLACGTGSLLARLERSADLLAGIDSSRSMLRIASGKLPSGLFAIAPLDGLPFREAFDTIFCLYDSLNYVPPEKLSAVLLEARRAVRKNGFYLFDVNNTEAYETIWADGEPYRVECERESVTIRSWYSPEERTGTADVDVECTVEGKKVVYRSHHIQTCHSTDEIEKALSYAGWKIVERESVDPFPWEEEGLPDGKDLYTVEAV